MVAIDILSLAAQPTPLGVSGFVIQRHPQLVELYLPMRLIIKAAAALAHHVGSSTLVGCCGAFPAMDHTAEADKNEMSAQGSR